MISIGHFAKLAQVSARTVRYYESIGLLTSAARGENNYRYYDSSLVTRVARIRDLQELGFSLDEIKEIIKISDSNFTESLKAKLGEVAAEISSLQERKRKIEELLSVSIKIDSKESLNDTERKKFMEAVREETLANLKLKHGHVSAEQLDFLNRDHALHGSPEKQKFFEALKACLEFARSKNLTLASARGIASSSITLYALGMTDIDPSEHQLLPERLSPAWNPQIHIDVEFERGQEFVDFCRVISSKLTYGQIEAFKMPLIDIINNVHARLGQAIDYKSIDEKSDVLLKPFQQADIEKIFLFDLSKDALVMKYEDHLPEYQDTRKISEYLREQKIHSFRDVMNISALWRPKSQGYLDRLERYKQAKVNPVKYAFISESLQESLKENYGLAIYHEDLARIIAEQTGWDLVRSNNLRRYLLTGHPNAQNDLEEFEKTVSAEVFQFIKAESEYSFCKSHIHAHGLFTKATAVLKSLHKEIYFEEIKKWEDRNGFVWDDIGIKIKGVSLLQN
jgi:DNA-binding transcriptional MerR regulator